MPDKLNSRNKSGFNYAEYFREMVLMNELTTMPEDKTWKAVPPTEQEHHDIVLYLGCNVLRTSHMIKTVTEVMDLLGVDYIAVGGPAYCCGIVHHRNGDEELASTLGSNAVRFFETFTPEMVVMWCPSCIYYYDEIFQVPASFETLHVTEFLADRLDEFNFIQPAQGSVSLHYHSDRPRRLQEARAAERLLSAVPGLTYVEIETDIRLGTSCSEASQKSTGIETWQQIIEQQIRQAQDAGAETLATLYHGCQRIICTYEERSPLTIEHYLSVFARALGIEHEDTYKKYKAWHNPELVLAEMAPCMVASGVSPDKARDIVTTTFGSD